MQNIIVIGLAGLAGTLARYWLSSVIDNRSGATFPFGTLAVNLIGCFVIGFLFHAFADKFVVHPAIRSAVFVGFLGGFTTFSSFGIQTFTLFEDGQMLWAVLNILLSNIGGLMLVWLGNILSRTV
jgi:CrcB protein